VDIEAALGGQQGGEQADRSGAGDQYRFRLEPGAGADLVDLVPGLRDHAGGFHQHADVGECGVERDGVVGFDPPGLAGVSVELFDAALGVAAVAAHVELAVRTRAARHRVRAPHHPHDEVSGGEAAAGRGVANPAEGFVADDQPLVAGWGPAVVTGGDLLVGAAHPHGQPVDEQVAVARLRVGYVGDGQGVLLLGYHGQGAHQCSSP
jgi:hypothetical protein